MLGKKISRTRARSLICLHAFDNQSGVAAQWPLSLSLLLSPLTTTKTNIITAQCQLQLGVRKSDDGWKTSSHIAFLRLSTSDIEIDLSASSNSLLIPSLWFLFWIDFCHIYTSIDTRETEREKERKRIRKLVLHTNYSRHSLFSFAHLLARTIPQLKIQWFTSFVRIVFGNLYILC